MVNLMQLGNRVVRRALRLRGVQADVRRVRGVDVHFYCAQGTGTAPPLLLVHGLGSSANAFVRALLPLTKTFRQVWAVDLPGNGFSPVPAGGPLALRELVEVLLEFRRQVIGERVVLLGNSLGGGMSLFAAAQEPEAFAGLALVSPAGARLEPERLQRLVESFRVDTAAQARVLAHKLFAKPPLAMLLFADELRKMVSTPTVKHVVATASADEFVTETMLARLTMPTLVIWGRNEKLLPPEALAYFKANLPAHAELDEVDAFGHMPQMEHPAQFVARIERFAREQRLT
jgi:pimeloyl-ACP methyl ester carboxylesterase